MVVGDRRKRRNDAGFSVCQSLTQNSHPPTSTFTTTVMSKSFIFFPAPKNALSSAPAGVSVRYCSTANRSQVNISLPCCCASWCNTTFTKEGGLLLLKPFHSVRTVYLLVSFCVGDHRSLPFVSFVGSIHCKLGVQEDFASLSRPRCRKTVTMHEPPSLVLAVSTLLLSLVCFATSLLQYNSSI